MAVQASETFTTGISFDNLKYEQHTVEIGDYYTILGENDLLVAGLRPVQPRTSRNVHVLDTTAHGALMVGGAFTEELGINPVTSRIVTDELYIETEFSYPMGAWYPAHIATDTWRPELVRKELRHILDVTAREGCHVELVLKDISTIRCEPNRLTQGCAIADEMTQEYAN